MPSKPSPILPPSSGTEPRYGRTCWEDASTINERRISCYDRPSDPATLPSLEPRKGTFKRSTQNMPVYDLDTGELIGTCLKEAAPKLQVSASHLSLILRTTERLITGRRVTYRKPAATSAEVMK